MDRAWDRETIISQFAEQKKFGHKLGMKCVSQETDFDKSRKMVLFKLGSEMRNI